MQTVGCRGHKSLRGRAVACVDMSMELKRRGKVDGEKCFWLRVSGEPERQEGKDCGWLGKVHFRGRNTVNVVDLNAIRERIQRKEWS